MPGPAFGFSARFDASDFEQYLRDWETKIVPAALRSSLTGTARAVRKIARKRVESVVGITPRESTKRIRIARPRPGGPLVAWIFLNKKAIVLRDSKYKINPYRQAVASSRGVRYSRHRFPKGFELRVNGTRAYFYRRNGALQIAKFPMMPAGEQIIGTSVETDGARIWKKLVVERMSAALRRKGSDRTATFFENLDLDAG